MPKPSRQKRWIAIGDTHGDMIDRDAAEKVFSFIKSFKPDLRIHAGDAFDLRPIRGGASASERAEGMQADVEAGLDLLKRFKPDVFLVGNHDDRLIRCMTDNASALLREHAGALWDQITTALAGVKILPYDVRDGIYRLGDWSFLHGYQHGMYVARQAAEHCASSAIQWHVHTCSEHPLMNVDGHVGMTCGCLCDLSMEYRKKHRSSLRWSHAFAYGYTDGETTTPFIARSVNGVWNV